MDNKTPKKKLINNKKWMDKNKQNYQTIAFRLNKKNITDKKIIDYLDNLDNKSDKIKDLLIEEINKKNN